MDADAVVLSFLEEILKAAGHEVLVASNGHEVWEVLHRNHIQLIITDWYMPEIDGIELCKKIRSTMHPGYVYIILLTPHDRKQDVIAKLSAGVDDLITKPFDSAELNLRVKIGERILSLETWDTTITSLTRLADSKDIATGLQMDRMRVYSRIVVSKLGNMHKYRDLVFPEKPV